MVLFTEKIHSLIIAPCHDPESYLLHNTIFLFFPFGAFLHSRTQSALAVGLCKFPATAYWSQNNTSQHRSPKKVVLLSACFCSPLILSLACSLTLSLSFSVSSIAKHQKSWSLTLLQCPTVLDTPKSDSKGFFYFNESLKTTATTITSNTTFCNTRSEEMVTEAHTVQTKAATPWTESMCNCCIFLKFWVAFYQFVNPQPVTKRSVCQFIICCWCS